MRIGITLNETVRNHYSIVEDVHEFFIQSINGSISKEIFEQLPEEVKDKVESRLQQFENLDATEIALIESKENLEMSPIKVFDLSNLPLDASIDSFEEYNEQNTSIERVLVEVQESDDPMNLSKFLTFKDKQEFEEFLYQDQAFEIFSRAPLAYPQVMIDLDKLYQVLSKRNHNITIVSQERDRSKSATLLFLSQNQFRGNNIKFLYDYTNVWELYDLIITADPFIAKIKPEGKICLLVETEHNSGEYAKGVFKFPSIKEIYNYIYKNLK